MAAPYNDFEFKLKKSLDDLKVAKFEIWLSLGVPSYFPHDLANTVKEQLWS